jgi:hypothetical protein
MIIKAFIGRHIDLSKIVAISDAYIVPSTGHGATYIYFEIHIQLLDAPIKYHRTLWPRIKPDEEELEILQAEIDDLVEQWKKVANG